MEIKFLKKPIELYFETHNPKYIAKDAVFIDMNTGEHTVGREAIANMLYYIYNIAFNAKAEITNTMVWKNRAVVEANFIGIHIGEFVGIPATRKSVNVPLCISYDLENELIKKARIYLMSSLLISQLKP